MAEGNRRNDFIGMYQRLGSRLHSNYTAISILCNTMCNRHKNSSQSGSDKSNLHPASMKDYIGAINQ